MGHDAGNFCAKTNRAHHHALVYLRGPLFMPDFRFSVSNTYTRTSHTITRQARREPWHDQQLTFSQLRRSRLLPQPSCQWEVRRKPAAGGEHAETRCTSEGWRGCVGLLYAREVTRGSLQHGIPLRCVPLWAVSQRIRRSTPKCAMNAPAISCLCCLQLACGPTTEVQVRDAQRTPL